MGWREAAEIAYKYQTGQEASAAFDTVRALWKWYIRNQTKMPRPNAGMAGRKRRGAARKFGPFDSVEVRRRKGRRFYFLDEKKVHFPPQPGRYVGPINTNYRKPFPSEYDKYGFSQVTETFGQNSMNDVNYIGVASVVPRHIAYNVGVSLARHIGWKHFKYEYQSVNDPLIPGLYTSSNANEAYTAISFFWRDRAVTAAGVVSDSMNESSIFTVKTGTSCRTVSEFADWFQSVITSTANSIESSGFFQVLDHYRIYGEQFGQAANEYADHSLLGMKVKLYSNVQFSIQNSTKADDGSVNIDVNNANPVKGKCYIFNGLAPRYSRYSGSNWGDLVRPDAWNWSSADGVHMVVGNPDVQYKVPPSAAVFSNCAYTYPVFLNPGEIKTKRGISTSGVYSLVKLVRMLRNTRQDGAVSSLSMRFGQLHLFALEQVVRTGTQPIVMNYQQKRTWGSVIYPASRVVLPRHVLAPAEANNPLP